MGRSSENKDCLKKHKKITMINKVLGIYLKIQKVIKLSDIVTKTVKLQFTQFDCLKAWLSFQYFTVR